MLIHSVQFQSMKSKQISKTTAKNYMERTIRTVSNKFEEKFSHLILKRKEE